MMMIFSYIYLISFLLVLSHTISISSENENLQGIFCLYYSFHLYTFFLEFIQGSWFLFLTIVTWYAVFVFPASQYHQHPNSSSTLNFQWHYFIRSTFRILIINCFCCLIHYYCDLLPSSLTRQRLQFDNVSLDTSY